MKKILLADDSITIQKVVELTFSEGDYQVVCVSNGAQALRKIPEVRPDVVLLDVIMPEKNGYEVCEQIKRNPATSGIPVLLLTGTFEPFDRKRADAAGAQGHLTKPFESQTLVSKVEELIAATPNVVSREEAGGMDVISGGDLYHVDPSPTREGMQRLNPPIPAGLSSKEAGAGSPGLDAGETRPAAAPTRPDPEDVPDPEWPHPAMQSPDPAAGGSYVGFADLGVGTGDEAEIVPDRYDDTPADSPSTARLSRDDLLGGAPGVKSPAPDLRGTGEADAPTEMMEGLTGAFESLEPTQRGRASVEPVREEEPAWTPPPEAPPAETWQSPDAENAAPPSPAAAGDSSPRSAPSAAAAAGTGPGNGALNLTPEAIDLIAEKVVERLSDRVVREIAWEVIPQVAETLVRRRIKELEDGEGG